MTTLTPDERKAELERLAPDKLVALFQKRIGNPPDSFSHVGLSLRVMIEEILHREFPRSST
jgi:hypothetical protein